VRLDGRGADVEPLGDVPVGRPLGEQLEHLGLPGGEGLDQPLPSGAVPGAGRGLLPVWGLVAAGVRETATGADRERDHRQQPDDENHPPRPDPLLRQSHGDAEDARRPQEGHDRGGDPEQGPAGSMKQRVVGG
jgi:hypothetical protein